MSIFLKIKGLICVLFAAATLLLPTIAAPFYDIDLNFSGLYFGNMFGVCFLGLGLICWAASASAASELKQSLLLSLAIADTAGFGFTLYRQLTGPIGVLGWSTVILWLVFAVGCWYYRFAGRD